MKKWLGLPVLLLLPVTAQASHPASAQQFAAVMQDPGHRQAVLQAAEQTPVWTHIACAAARFTPSPEIAVYIPVTFDKQGAPLDGEWREGIAASGCGAPITLNVLTQVTAPATLATGYLLPGGSIADPILQNAAQGFAVKAAGGIPPGCTDAYIANTEFAGYEGPGAATQTGPWKELWTLDLCGPPKQILVHFETDATGTTIDAVPADKAQNNK
jgi:hypothetical protein